MLADPFSEPSSDEKISHYPDGHAESVDVDVSEIELFPAVTSGRDVRAEMDISMASEANHLQDRCVDLATELFFVKNKLDEKTKELKWARREGQAREKDFKEVRRLCDEEQHSARTLMRQIKTLEQEKAKAIAESNELRVDKERLLGVLRRHKAAGLSESMAAHRDRLRKRKLSEKEVNKCDLAKAKMDLKTMAQENERLVAKTRAQAAHVLALEDENAELARQLSDAEHTADVLKGEAEVARKEVEEAMESERRARSEMQHETALREHALEQVAQAEKAQAAAVEMREAAEEDAEALRQQLATVMQQLSDNKSAHGRHDGSVVRYQKTIDAQASALQGVRQQLLAEKVRRQELERQVRLRHIANIDNRIRSAGGEGGNDSGGRR